MEADNFPLVEGYLVPLTNETEEEQIQLPDGLTPDFNETHDKNAWQRAREWASRHKGKLALGAIATSTALTFAFNPTQEVKDRIVEAAPIIGVGIAGSEAMFVGGAAIMASAVGSKVGNPLKLKERLPEICEKANDSLLFKSGFWINTVGAVGTAAFFSAGVLAKMPPESYGVLSFAGADLALTVAVRKAMLSGIRSNIQKESTDTKTE